MSVAGIGTDLVEIARIGGALRRHGHRFGARILTPLELRDWQEHHYSERFLAKRFAAKEAAAKALGTGFAEGVRWQDVEVGHDGRGKPLLRFYGGAALRGEALGVTGQELSISDERQYALAFVVLLKA